MSSNIIEKMGLWLGQMYLLSNWDLLGDKATQMGTKCKSPYFFFHCNIFCNWNGFIIQLVFETWQLSIMYFFSGKGWYFRRMQMHGRWQDEMSSNVQLLPLIPNLQLIWLFICLYCKSMMVFMFGKHLIFFLKNENF